MKRFLILVLILITCAGFYGCDVPTENSESQPTLITDDFVLGAWVPTVYGLNFPETPTTDDTLLKAQIDEIVLNSKNAGLNTLFFQALPSCDAFYKSNIYPWSRYLTGTHGQAPNNNFDPLQYFIEVAHNNNIELHAWVNPLRVTTSASHALDTLHPLYYKTDLTFTVNDKIYLDAGNPEAREFVINGVKEIASKYNIDGIHFDDYFYPEGTIPDQNTYLNNRQPNQTIDEFRTQSINKLITETHSAIKAIDTNIEFGVSPPGIWANYSNNSLGSYTNGFESLYNIYADSYYWVENKIVDYIAPQIYWHIGQTHSDFTNVMHWWTQLCEKNNVKLYAGIAGYKQDDITYGESWLLPEQISNQIDVSAINAQGAIIYTYKDILKQNVQNALDNYQTASYLFANSC